MNEQLIDRNGQMYRRDENKLFYRVHLHSVHIAISCSPINCVIHMYVLEVDCIM